MITRLSLQPHSNTVTKRREEDEEEQEEAEAQRKTTSRHFDSLSPTSESPPSSISTTESTAPDPLSSGSMTRHVVPSSNSGRNSNSSADSPKSPILIKYNYYDYNGARQEQPNQDMRHNQQQQQQHHQENLQATSASKSVQRQLSPSFRENLDHIVRNSSSQIEKQQQRSNLINKNGSMSSSSISSPSPSPISSCASSSPDHQNQSQSQNQPHQNNHQVMIHLARRYQLSSYEQRCLRCNKTVYQMDKVGPLKEFTFYHQNCFKCRECGTKLTLRTYFNNQQFSNDLEVYCHRHCPKTGPGKLDNQSVGIRAALNAPKVFDSAAAMLRDDQPVSGSVANCNSAPNYNSSTINANISANYHYHQQQLQLQLQLQNGHHGQQHGQQQPRVDSGALYIQHAVQQTKLQNIYKQSQVDKKISQFLERRLEYLEPKQKLLEMRHREEEDALFKAFELKWRQEEKSISEQIRDEWQFELNKLLEKYKRQLSSISNQVESSSSPSSSSSSASSSSSSSSSKLAAAAAANNFSRAAAELLQPKQPLSSRREEKKLQVAAEAANASSNKQQLIEFERLNLEKTMTIKLDRKKETLKRKLKEFERQATAELVEKQSREMLALISMKLDEYKEEQKRKIGSDLDHFEAIEKLANRLAGSSLGSANNPDERLKRSRPTTADQQQQQQQPKAANNNNNKSSKVTLETPPPEAPKVSKMELYNYEEPDEVFRDIDQLAINVAKEDQRTFTDLVHHLTRNCLTDVERVRAIFRWITVKNLNTMDFDSSVKPDTPLGLLRGIKNGSESYHVLFKRLCSYAGLHCVVIKGYSKSAGYQPGIKFEGNRFRNSWNAVYVAGAWRFVQCNWGARHLVSVAIMQDKNQPAANNGGLANLSNNNNHHHHLDPSSLRHAKQQQQQPSAPLINAGRSHQQPHRNGVGGGLQSPNHGRRGLASSSSSVSSSSTSLSSVAALSPRHPHHHHHHAAAAAAAAATADGVLLLRTPASMPHAVSSSNCSTNNPTQPTCCQPPSTKTNSNNNNINNNNLSSSSSSNDSLRYEYDDHYFLTDPDEFIYEFFPIAPEWQLLKSRPIGLAEFEQLPFVRSLFFKYGLYFPQHNIRSVLHTDSSGATTIKIGMPTHMIPSLIFHYNLKYYDSDLEQHDGISLKRFVMQSIESGGDSSSSSSSSDDGQLSNVVSFRVHLPENGAYILDIFANSTTPYRYITGEPMKFKSVCKFKIVAKNLKTVMIPLPDCASGEYGPMKATRLFGIIPITHESALISVQNDKRFLEIQFRMTRPLVDFMASLHKNNYDEKQLSKSIKIFVDGDIVFVTVKFFEDGQYGLDIYTRDQSVAHLNNKLTTTTTGCIPSNEPKKQLLTHCCKYLINVRTPTR